MVTPGASTEPVLSAAEAIEAVEHMSAADLLRFKKASHYLSFGGARPPGGPAP
jgi:hypothetical protein